MAETTSRLTELTIDLAECTGSRVSYQIGQADRSRDRSPLGEQPARNDSYDAGVVSFSRSPQTRRFGEEFGGYDKANPGVIKVSCSYH
jgi:hypothetical protein